MKAFIFISLLAIVPYILCNDSKTAQKKLTATNTICMDKYFKDTESGLCFPCHPLCAKCEGTNDYCSACITAEHVRLDRTHCICSSMFLYNPLTMKCEFAEKGAFIFAFVFVGVMIVILLAYIISYCISTRKEEAEKKLKDSKNVDQILKKDQI